VNHRFAVPLVCALFASLSACHKAEEENVQVRAENASRALEERYKQIEAEAANDTDEAVAPLDAEANAFLANHVDANAAVGANTQ
jgi:hypothetical protein